MIASTMSLADTLDGTSPSTVIAIVPGLICGSVLSGEHVPRPRFVPMPNANAPKGAVRGGVAVAAHDRHARLGETLLGPDDVDDSLPRIAHSVRSRMPNSSQLRAEYVHLLGGDRIGQRLVEVGGRDVCGPSSRR